MYPKTYIMYNGHILFCDYIFFMSTDHEPNASTAGTDHLAAVKKGFKKGERFPESFVND